jgi:putative ABC transport system permease protein
MDLLRLIRRDPLFASAATLSIGLAVGANTAIFSIVNSLWLRSSAVAQADRVVVPYRGVASSEDGAVFDVLPRDTAERFHTLSTLAGAALELATSRQSDEWRPVLRLRDGGSEVETRAVSHDYFTVLGVPVHGHGFTSSDDHECQAAAVVVSESFSRRLSGADPKALLGRELATTDGSLTVVGVTAAGFVGPRLGETVDAWIPLGCLPRLSETAAQFTATGEEFMLRRRMPMTVFARLAEGVSLAEAQAEVRALVAPDTELRSLGQVAFRLRATGDLERQRTLILALWTAAVLVLLLGCANLTSLFIARAEHRRHSTAVRLALGASPARLIRSAVLEGGAIALAGLGSGLVLRVWLLHGVNGMSLPSGVTMHSLQPTLDWRVLLCGAVVSLVAISVAGTEAWRHGGRADVISALMPGDRRTASGMASRQVLLATHSAVALVLLGGTASFAMTVAMAAWSDPGFDQSRVLFASVRARLVQHAQFSNEEFLARRWRDYFALMEKLRELPGTIAVSYGEPPIHEGSEPLRSLPVVVGDRAERLTISIVAAGPDYLTALGATILSGRDLRPGEDSAAVVDQTLSRRFWAGESPLDATLRIGPRAYRVVGVTRPLIHDPLTSADAPTLVSYEPFDENDAFVGRFNLVIRTTASASAISPSVRTVIMQAFPSPAFFALRTGSEIIASRTSRQRFVTAMMSWHASTAVLLATLGTIGLAAFVAVQGRRELAVRAALGAPMGALRRIVLARAIAPVAVGVTSGIVVLVLAMRVVEGWLVGMPSTTWPPLALSAVCFIGLAVVAALIGSRSVYLVDPVNDLRS